MSDSGESKRRRKIAGVKLALAGAGAVLGAIMVGLHQLDVDQLNPHPRLGV